MSWPKLVRASERKDALATLLNLYQQRPDLQEVFPEASNGDHNRLIGWAAGVSGGKLRDSSYSLLLPFASWFAENFRPVKSLPNWPQARHASESSFTPLPATIATMQGETSDISHHLSTLALLIIEFKLRKIVELGTREGDSTLTFLEAARKVEGTVFSVDVDACIEAKRRIREAGLQDGWTFVQANDLELDLTRVPQPVDLLFIDTVHSYTHTVAELKRYAPLVKIDGWIVLHDYISFPEVGQAVHEFIEASVAKPSFYPYVHQNGLAILRCSGRD